jgi:hypothetical protein
MSIRRQPQDGEFPQLPDIDPVAAEDIPDIIREFCSHHADRPRLLPFPDNASIYMEVGPPDRSAGFVMQISTRSINFLSSTEIETVAGGRERIQGLFAALADGVAFGELDTTDEGVQWSWAAPALPYPWLHGNVMHAIAYSEYLAEFVWPIAGRVAAGELAVDEAVATLNGGDDAATE